MGFETTFLLSESTFLLHLKYPYGIWNMVTLKVLLFLIHLKYPYGIWNSISSNGFSLPPYLKYPYGIWNTSSNLRPLITSYLKYPYGIWNIMTINVGWLGIEFEVSLWDLKLNSILAGQAVGPAFEVSLWDLKLQCKFSDNVRQCIWSIPMGFETHFC